MLRDKKYKKIIGALLVGTLLCSHTAVPGVAADEKADAAAENGEGAGITVQTEVAKDTLYFDALTKTESKTQKYTTVKRGDFVLTATVGGTVIYPKTERIRYDFPYGVTYFLESVGMESSVKSAGDAIAQIYVEMDHIELASRERQLQRMEERGETGSFYEEMKKEYDEMMQALTKTEILIEEDCILLEQEHLRFGTRIDSYTIIVADKAEQLIEVSNENKQFRYGQQVKVTAKIGGTTQSGTGRVITASANTVSEDLAGTTAYIRLDEGSEHLYAGSGIMVTVETVHMEDVLLLDAGAVYMDNGVQMVKVKDEYGLHAVTFSYGRKGTNTYWIIDGLSEGTEVLIQ